MQTVEGRARPLKPIRTCWIDAPRKASPSNPSSHVMCSNLLVHISALQSCFLCNIAVWADSGPFCSRFVCLNKRQIITKRGIEPIFTPICQLHRDEWIRMLFRGLNLNGRPECYWTSISLLPLLLLDLKWIIGQSYIIMVVRRKEQSGIVISVSSYQS